jgi:queuine tRNA-ribosyltransferase
MRKLEIKKKKYQLPIYLPDATRAVVRSVDSKDLLKLGVDGVVVNTYHLMSEPGVSVLKKMGGIKKLMNFDGLVVSDSGGWQIFSSIHRSGGRGKISDEGVIFGFENKKKEIFTPEKSIQVQFDIGSDIIICLDDFTSPEAETKEIEKSVERTILWAKKSREEFDRQVKKRRMNEESRPHLLAVIQGGWDKELRAHCAKELLKIGFDLYGYGGYTVKKNGKQDLEMAKFVAELIPDEFAKFALGAGRPNDIAEFHRFGWNIFDCVLPTRDGRHKRLYAFKKEIIDVADLAKKENYGYLYLSRQRYGDDKRPISKFCDCHTCANHSRAYLHHLFKIGDFSAHRLATIHNLRVYTKLIEILRSNS